MNIHYEGASDDNNNMRFAIIYYQPKEEQKVERFASYIESYNYKYFFEEESLYIEVDDKDDYDYINYCFQNYKKMKWNENYPKKCHDNSYEGAYGVCDSDEEFYCYLVDTGHSESAIKSIFDRVSGGPDAYQNGLNCVTAIIM